MAKCTPLVLDAVTIDSSYYQGTWAEGRSKIKSKARMAKSLPKKEIEKKQARSVEDIYFTQVLEALMPMGREVYLFAVQRLVIRSWDGQPVLGDFDSSGAADSTTS